MKKSHRTKKLLQTISFTISDVTHSLGLEKKNIGLKEKMLGLIIDNNLDFSDHISNIYKAANQKLNALFRASARILESLDVWVLFLKFLGRLRSRIY